MCISSNGCPTSGFSVESHFPFHPVQLHCFQPQCALFVSGALINGYVSMATASSTLSVVTIFTYAHNGTVVNTSAESSNQTLFQLSLPWFDPPFDKVTSAQFKQMALFSPVMFEIWMASANNRAQKANTRTINEYGTWRNFSENAPKRPWFVQLARRTYRFVCPVTLPNYVIALYEVTEFKL